MTQMFKKGDKVECVDAAHANNLVEGKIYEVFSVDESHLRVIDDSGVTRGYYVRRFKPAEPFPLANTKINVQKYAEENELQQDKAVDELLGWFSLQGYRPEFNPARRDVKYLFTDSFAHRELGFSAYTDYFNENGSKEITLSRKVTVELTPSFVEAEEPTVEYVELGGRKYVKADLEEALSKIKAVEE